MQDRLGYTAAVASAYTSTRPVLTEQHMLFHSALPFLAVGTLDSQGRPWGSFLARDGHNDFIECSDPGKLIAKIKLSQEDPLRHTLKDGAIIGEDQLITAAVRASGKANGVGPKGKRPIGAVGIMFHNRRRNKFAGWVRTARLASKDDDEEQVELELDVDQSLGEDRFPLLRSAQDCIS